MDNENTADFAELLLCANDFIYFCEKYIKIKYTKKGGIPFKLYDYQKRYIKLTTDKKYVIGKKFRQGGFTTLNMAWLVWRALFKSNESNAVFCGTDRECEDCREIVWQIIKLLPIYFSKNFIDGKNKDIESSIGSKISFFSSYKSFCGKYIDNLFIEEAAYISDIELNRVVDDYTFKSCFIISTMNGSKNWFEETYQNALKSNNQFIVFNCSYLEHPDYKNLEWQNKTKAMIGENLWKEQYLCGSVDTNKDKKDNYYLKFVKSISEEKTLIKKLTKINNDKSILDYITENDSPIKLVGDDDDDKSLFKQYHNYNEIAEQQLNFDRFMGGKDFKIYYLSEDVEKMAEEQIFSSEYCNLQNFIDLKKRKIKELECRIDDSLETDEFFVLAGLMQTYELNQNNEDSPRLSEQLLEKTIEIGKLQENIRIYFYDKKLYVNGIATNIDEFSLFCLYNGLVAFISHEKALIKVAKLLIKRLRPLFGIEYEVSK